MSSKRHNLVGSILRTCPQLKNYRAREEVSVSDLAPGFPDNRKKVDWYVHELRLVIEVHGEQHYQPVAFGNRNAKQAFGSQIHRDIQKQKAIEDAGYYFLEIPYYQPLDEDSLWGLICRTIQEGENSKPVVERAQIRANRRRSTIPSRPFAKKLKKIKESRDE